MKQEITLIKVAFKYDGPVTTATAVLPTETQPWMVARGVARLHPNDKPDTAIGENLALSRALVEMAVRLWMATGV